MNNTTTDIVFRDIQQMQRAISDMQSQMMRIWKTTRMDERAVAIEKQENENHLLTLVADNTKVVAELLHEMRSNRLLESDAGFYAWRKGAERAQYERNARRDEMLEGCSQVVVDTCSCGKHKGIRFVDKNEKVVEELCPLNWWVTQSKLAYRAGTLGSFVSSTPLDKYLKQYAKK